MHVDAAERRLADQWQYLSPTGSPANLGPHGPVDRLPGFRGPGVRAAPCLAGSLLCGHLG
jgi:hypothetical protein